ncbi:GIY-YIG catalytic domain protein [Caballeronia arationis]|uniref:DUF488 family protein, N3 subclade n=1 Tax=Caballeronia arationis TaxID=1777142 RepID=UPI00074CC31A|nr:GIY-YIG nuclease family protein [Caballeronia arationis]SAK59382.1 GIY-YIG catalytic domain protein [Caballeronia arationis]
MTEQQDKAYVYIFHNPETGDVNVGSTKDEKYRQRKHLSALRGARHSNYKFQRCYARKPNFEFVSMEVPDRDTALALEQSIIDEFYGSPSFLNISKDAAYCNVWQSPASIERMRKALTGRKLSAEHIEKSRQGLLRLNRKMSAEQKERLRECFKGIPLSAATKAKLSISGKARFDDPLERLKISVGHRGKLLSAEHRAKLSLVARGRKDTDAKRLNMRRGNAYRSKSVLIDGTTYRTLAEAAEALGVHKTTITNRIKAGLYQGAEQQDSSMHRKMTIWTIQLSKWRLARELGIHLIDCTARSGISAFAPLFDDVMAYKRGVLSEEQYTKRYLARMRHSRREQSKEWERVKTLPERIALACYCKAGVFCHRHLFRDLLSDYLKDAQFEVKCAGELISSIPPHVKAEA